MSAVTAEAIAARLGSEGLVLLDVRTEAEYRGAAGYPCDARQGHIPGARHLDLQQLVADPSPAAVRALVGEPEGTEVIAYCHSGGRSAMAAQVLRAAGYAAHNYVGSWHEWAALAALEIETGV